MSEPVLTEPERLLEAAADAIGRCIVFDDVELPPGATPARARVGIEGHPDGSIELLVDPVAYRGHPAVQHWLTAGTLRFVDSTALDAFLTGPVGDAYRNVEETKAATSTLDPIFIEPRHLAERLEVEIVGQDFAIEQLAASTTTHLARSAPRRPMTALLVGPTGVGKTLTAQTLADAIAESGDGNVEYLRIDCTELAAAHDSARLYGSPPGYVGFADDTPLTRALRTPRAVVLFDEIEKAHPDIFTSLLPLLDEGRITPATGPTLDARGAILLFTTNLCADLADEFSRRNIVDLEALDTCARDSFRRQGLAPELVGRMGAFIRFDRLTDQHSREIIRRSISREAATFGLHAREIDPSIIETIRRKHPDPGSGVRGWEHLISRHLSPIFVDATRKNINGPVKLLDDPTRIEPDIDHESDRADR